MTTPTPKIRVAAKQTASCPRCPDGMTGKRLARHLLHDHKWAVADIAAFFAPGTQTTEGAPMNTTPTATSAEVTFRCSFCGCDRPLSTFVPTLEGFSICWSCVNVLVADGDTLDVFEGGWV